MSKITDHPNFNSVLWVKEYILTALSIVDPDLINDEEEFYEYHLLHVSGIHEEEDNQWCRACLYSEWLNKFNSFLHNLIYKDRSMLERHFYRRWCVSEEKAKEIVDLLLPKLNITLDD